MLVGGEFSQHCATLQGKKLFFHFTCPSDKYFADFGCPNMKSTRPKKIKRCLGHIGGGRVLAALRHPSGQKNFFFTSLGCDLYHILCKLSTPDLTKLKKKCCSRVLHEFQSSKAKTYSSQTSGRVKVFLPCSSSPGSPEIWKC